MSPVLAANLRRHWQLVGAGAVLLVLLALHVVVFLPTQRRYARAVQALGGVDAALEPPAGSPPMPPRVYAFVNENAMTEAEAARRTASGQLTVMMLEDLSTLAAHCGLAVVLSEPGPVTPLPGWVEARVHLRVSGGYRRLIEFLHAIEATGRLYDLDRYAIADHGGGPVMELWAVRMLLKRPERPR